MKILNTLVMAGPNYWSNNRKKLIVMKINLEKYEDFPTNLLPGFNESLQQLLPSLYEHRCSERQVGGFYQRLAEGTWLGHVIEHIALEMQHLAGMNCVFGRTYEAEAKGIYQVIFSYKIPDAGLYAGEAAFNLVKTLAAGKVYTNLQNDIEYLKRRYEKEKLGPSTYSILKEAKHRKIPITYLDAVILLGQGIHQRKIWATMTSQTSGLASDIATDKDLTKKILAFHYLPVPRGKVVKTQQDLQETLEDLDYPVVTKPVDGNHGNGITTHIDSYRKALIGFNLAKDISPKVIVEQHIYGDDYRFLVVNYKVVAVARRRPATVIGDGIHSIRALIDEINQNPKRGSGHENYLTTIKVDASTLSILAEKNLSLASILPQDTEVAVKHGSNLSVGGTATDVTAIVHPLNISIAERAARLVNLDICGIDIVAKNITMPLFNDNGAILEINASPGFRMHLNPCGGTAINVAAPVLDMLFPNNAPSRIPLVAVTGTNGKTTVVRLLARLAKAMQYKVGFTTTEGIYVDEHMIYQGDCSGPESAQRVLQDPWVNFAVLECARGGILRSGLGFDHCNVSIITNVTNDHLGLNDIHSLKQLAEVKSVVARSTLVDGYTILNADNDLVYDMRHDVSCNIALFSMSKTERIQEHCNNNGWAVYIKSKKVFLQKGREKPQFLAHIADFPVTLGGTAACMVQNILPVILAGALLEFPLDGMVQVLHNFTPTPDNLPGRMNIFEFENFKVMVDYAHNEAAFEELKKYMHHVQSPKKVGIISATGDRKPDDIQKIGFYAAEIFDEVIIRHDKDGRGRTNDELTELLMQGINTSSSTPEVKIISDEKQAIQHAMDQCMPGTFIYYFGEDVLTTINYMQKEARLLHNQVLL